MAKLAVKVVIPFTDRGQREGTGIVSHATLKGLNVKSVIEMVAAKRQRESGAISITCDLVASR